MEICRFVVSPIRANCYVLSESLDSGSKAVIVDPGDTALDDVFTYIDDHQFRVVANWNTHAHFDHVLGIDLVRNTYGCPSYLHPLGNARLARIPAEAQKWAQLQVPPLREADLCYEDGDMVTLGDESFTVWHTPGHSPDGVCLVGTSIALTGDTLFRGTVGRTDLDDSSPEAMEASLLRILAWSDELVLYPGHGQESTMREERDGNRFLRILSRGGV